MPRLALRARNLRRVGAFYFELCGRHLTGAARLSHQLRLPYSSVSGVTAERGIRHARPNFFEGISPSAHKCRTVRSDISRIEAAVGTSTHRVPSVVSTVVGIGSKSQFSKQKRAVGNTPVAVRSQRPCEGATLSRRYPAGSSNRHSFGRRRSRGTSPPMRPVGEPLECHE